MTRAAYPGHDGTLLCPGGGVNMLPGIWGLLGYATYVMDVYFIL